MDIDNAIVEIDGPLPFIDRLILLCTEERTGSQLLSQHMATTGVLGRPYEYFNNESMKALHASYPTDLAGQFKIAQRLAITPNGVFSIKMHGETMEQVLNHIPLFSFSKVYFVYLIREDILGQAISLVKARKSNVWHKLAGAKLQSLLKLPKADDFDPDLLLSVLEDMCHRRTRWEIYFARNGIKPLRISYEALVSDPQKIIGAIASYAEIEEEALLNKEEFFENYMKTADETNDRWRQGFVKEFSNLYRFGK